MPGYAKLQPGDAHHAFVERAKLVVRGFVCDARGHNEAGGCPNPECWKFKGKKEGE